MMVACEIVLLYNELSCRYEANFPTMLLIFGHICESYTVNTEYNNKSDKISDQ